MAFSEQSYAESRAFHELVLDMCEEIGFRGGAGSALFDIAMIDQVEGDLNAARNHYQAAFEAYEAGGYSDRLPIVRQAIDGLVV